LWEDTGWIEMDEVLFGNRGVKKLKLFAEKIGWKEMVWEKGGWKGEEKRKGRRLIERLRGGGGYLLGWSEEEREELRRRERERMRKKRNLRAHVTSPNASEVTGAVRLTERMREDG